MVPGIRRNPLHQNHSTAVSLLQGNHRNEPLEEGDVPQRLRVVAFEDDGSKHRQEIIWYQQQIKLIGHRAEQLEAERDNAHYNTQIWQRRVEEQQEKLDERDKAIARLVAQNLQANTVNIEELKANHEQEYTRTLRWHKSMLKTKDDRIEELQRQVTKFKAYNSQISSAQSSQVSNLICEVDRLKGSLRYKEQECTKVTKRVKELEKQLGGADAIPEMKGLLSENEALSAQLRELKRQLWRVKDSSGEVEDLKHELANAQKQIKTLDLERSNLVEKTRREVEETVRSELQEAQKTHQLLEARLATMEAMKMPSSPTSTNDVASLGGKETQAQLKTKIQHLTNQLDSKTNLLRISQAKNRSLEIELRSKTKQNIDYESDFSPSVNGATSESQTQNQFGKNEVEDLRRELDKAEKEMKKIDEIASTQLNRLVDRLESNNKASSDEVQKKLRELEAKLVEAKTKEDALQTRLDEALSEKAKKEALDQAQKAREASEKSIVRTFERHLADLSSDKDAALDVLRRDLAAVRAKRDDEVTGLNRELRLLRSQLESIHNDYNERLKHKDQHIYALEHTLHAQEQAMDNMRIEMDQLQSGMQDAAASRRGEVESLEQEVMFLRAEISKQEKQVTNLRMQLKEEQLGHREEVLRLEEIITETESKVPKLKAKATVENNMRIKMVQGRLDQLKVRNEELKEENKRLSERLEKGIIKIQALETKSKAAGDVKIECEILRRQVAILQRVLDQKDDSTEASSLPEVEMADKALKNGATTDSSLERRPRPESKQQMRARKSTAISIARLFKRKKATTASIPPTVPEKEQAKRPRGEIVSIMQAGRTMTF